MSTPDRKSLADALDAAAGRRDRRGIAPELLAWADSLRATRRRLAASESCPTRFLERARSIPEGMGGAPEIGRLLRLVFDSWRDAAPALRGPGRARLLRFEDAGHGLDVRITRDAGEWVVHLAVDPERPDLVATAEFAGAAHPVEEALDESGAGRLLLPGATRSFVVTVGTREAPLVRSEPIQVEAR